jgi:hypothetical protein
VSVALVIQHAKRMRRIILSSVACLALPHYCTLSHKWHDIRKKVIEHKMCFLFSLKCFSVTFLILRRIQRDIAINLYRSSCKVPGILMKLEFSRHVFEKHSISNFMMIRPVRAELFHADRRRDMMMLIVAFLSFANAPKKLSVIFILIMYCYFKVRSTSFMYRGLALSQQL